ncbi:MAG: hypothetical protein U5N56_00110 [Candidatus Marinimicrobia bacterium]|nr:hypothetical protein [Candidatus Neomarinimicrobiota bacterium]
MIGATITGSKINLDISYAVKQFESEANHLFDMAELQVRRLMMQGYSRNAAIDVVMGQIQRHEGFAKAYWNRQNRLIRQLENELVAQPVNEWANQNPKEKLKWVLGEVKTHHCSDCLRLSKMDPGPLMNGVK